MTIADTLREARRRIEEPEKWAHYPDGLSRSSSKLCVVLAIGRVCNMTADGEDIERFMAARTCFERAVNTYWLPQWNDAPERTHAEVLAAFDRAIVLAELEKP